MKSIPAVLVGIDFLLLNKREENKNELYLSVVLTKKESRYPHGNLKQSPLNTATPASTISIADLVEIVNPSEGDFLKYFPASMLDSEQIEGKNKAFAKDAEKIEKLSEDKKRSLATAENADALSSTPETTSSTASNNIVPQDNDIVNDSVCTDVKDVYNGDANAVLEEFVADVMSGMFDIQREIGFGFPFSKMPVSRIEEILKNNWSGQHFSARIWGRAEDINQTLKEELLTQFMTGRSYRKTASEISDRMAVGAYEARRLARTESTYIANSAELESYKECGIEQFRFLATLDMRTSDLCASMDGKVFPIDEGVPGTNIPPLHPWCRSTTVAVIDGAVLSDLKRRARDPETGKPYLVSADTTYEEWKKELDQRFGEGYSATKRKMVQNRAKDSKQYQKYIAILGKENLPKSLDEFQNLKYNNTERWQFVKLDYSRQHRLIEHPELALPNAERVFIDDRKFTEYLFNPLNKKGYAKGKAIISRLGYDITNFDQLKKVVESSAFKYPSTFRSNNGYGDQYEQKIVLYGLKEKPANVIVGWIADGNDTKLTSLYIKER